MADSDESKSKLVFCGRKGEGNSSNEKWDYFPLQWYRNEEEKTDSCETPEETAKVY